MGINYPVPDQLFRIYFMIKLFMPHFGGEMNRNAIGPVVLTSVLLYACHLQVTPPVNKTVHDTFFDQQNQIRSGEEISKRINDNTLPPAVENPCDTDCQQPSVARPAAAVASAKKKVVAEKKKTGTPKSEKTKTENPTATSSVTLEQLTEIADDSACTSRSWRGRGLAPKSYIKGVLLVFAKALCNLPRSDIKMASRPPSGDKAHDALTWYNQKFASLGMKNQGGGDTLRHTYTLLLGLGMRESTGRHCCGKDRSARNYNAETAEAGLFQTSYNSHASSPELDRLFKSYSSGKVTCLQGVFKKDVSCGREDWQDWGDGPGREFQRLSKTCPAFATEYAAVLLRVDGGSRGHYGPLRRRDAEVRPECDDMLGRVQKMIEANQEFCKLF